MSPKLSKTLKIKKKIQLRRKKYKKEEYFTHKIKQLIVELALLFCPTWLKKAYNIKLKKYAEELSRASEYNYRPALTVVEEHLKLDWV